MAPSKGSRYAIRVLNVDRSQTHFLSRSMTISREISFEKVLEWLMSEFSTLYRLMNESPTPLLPQHVRCGITRALAGNEFLLILAILVGLGSVGNVEDDTILGREEGAESGVTSALRRRLQNVPSKAWLAKLL